MSDIGRKDFSTKAKEAMIPDHSKSTTQRIKESITDTGDRAAAGLNPDSNKSAAQSTFDKSRREKDHINHQTGNGPMDKVKNALGLNHH